MAMGIPNNEQLALSASIFTSSIDSWIPASFGPKISDHDRKLEFDKRLKEASLQGENDKLGVGHPDYGVYKPKGPSMSSLEKKLGKVDKKVKQVEEDIQVKMSKEEDSEEEDSRVRSVSKRKVNPALDLLRKKNTKGKAKATTSQPAPLLNLGVQDKEDEASQSSDSPPTPLSTQAASSPGGSGTFPFTGPVSLDSPQAKRIVTPVSSGTSKRKRESLEQANDSSQELGTTQEAGSSKKNGVEGMSNSNGSLSDLLRLETSEHAATEESQRQDQDEGKLSKTQRRRDARKRAKLARQS